jgi:hypothetical protein
MNIIVDNTSSMFTFDDTTELLSSTLSKMGHNVKVNNGELCSYAKLEQNPDYVFTSLVVFDKDMAHYLANNITKTIFIINIETQSKVKDILEMEDFLHKYKVNYKFVVNNHRSRKIIFKYQKNVINFIYGTSGYLLSDTTMDWKGRNIEFLMVANDQALDIKMLSDIQKEYSIHALRTTRDNSNQTAHINMDQPLINYKNILQNYNKILYYAPCIGRDFFELCKLRKPIYTVSSPVSIASKALKIEGLDITWENRKENKDINWNQIYDKVDNDFSFEGQVKKLMSHLPKVSK